MKKLLITLLIVISIFISIPSMSFASSIKIKASDENGPSNFEITISDLCISIGDSVTKLLNRIVGQSVSVKGLVFNEINAVNANFFNKSVNDTSATEVIRKSVNKWYNFFLVLAITTYLIALLMIGIRIVYGSTAGGMAKTQEIFVKWLTNVILLFTMPLIVKYAFQINEALVDMISRGTGNRGTNLGSSIGSTEGEWSPDEIEFRSPEYVSRFTGLPISTEKYNEIYQKQLSSYKANLDINRIMRAYAGITKKYIYVLIWYILLSQTITMLIKYYKRYFVLALLIAFFPVVAMFNMIEIARGKNGAAFSSWCKEVFVNIFMQSLHAIIYAIIASVAISRVADSIIKENADTMNWLLIVVAINFLSEGEKIARKLLGANASTFAGIGETGKMIRGKARDAVSGGKRIAGAVGGGKHK